MRWLAASILAIGLASCAAPPAADFYVAQAFSTPSARSLVLLLHTPADEPAYRAGDANAKHLVTESLKQAGYRVRHIEYAEYGPLLGHEMRRLHAISPRPGAKEIADAELHALRNLARAVCNEAESPLLLRTRLLTRPTTLWQSVATWDGQKRQVKFVEKDKVLANIQGTGPGMSLEVIAADPDGKLVARSYGGASLPYISGRSGYAIPRDDLFADNKELAEGIAIALLPLLPK